MAARSSPLWQQLHSATSDSEAIPILYSLLNSHQSVSSLNDGAKLVQILTAHPTDPNFARPCLLLLSRWARSQNAEGLRPWDRREPTGAHEQQAQVEGSTDNRLSLLHQTLTIAKDLLASHGIAHPLGSPAALFICSAAAGLSTSDESAAAAEVVIRTMLDNCQPLPPQAATDIISAIGALLSSFINTPKAVFWVLTALLLCLNYLQMPLNMGYLSVHDSLDTIAPLYPLMRSFAMNAVTTSLSASSSGIEQLLTGLQSTLRSVTLGYTTCGSDFVPKHAQNTRNNDELQQASAVLLLAGFLDGLLRSPSRVQVVAVTASNIEQDFIAVINMVATSTTYRGGNLPYSQRRMVHNCSLLTDACSFAILQLFQTVRRPLPSQSTILCLATTLFQKILILEPLLFMDQGLYNKGVAEEINQRIHRHTGSTLFTQAGAVGRCLVEQCLAVASSPSSRDLSSTLCQLVCACSESIHSSYRHYILTMPEFIHVVDGTAIRLVLQRTFSACFEVLATIAAIQRPTTFSILSATIQNNDNTNNGGGMSSELAVAVLSVAGNLQFCRGQVADSSSGIQYANLLRAALAVLPNAGEAAAEVVESLPCYADVAHHVINTTGPPSSSVGVAVANNEAVGGGQPGVWEIDAVSAAKVQFLFSALIPALKALPQVLILDRLLPLAFLYMPHPHPPTAAAAHQIIWSAMYVLPPEQAQQLAPYYTARCLEGYPERTSAQQVAQGLAHVLQGVPCTSSVGVVCLEELAEKCKRSLFAGIDVPYSNEWFKAPDPAAVDLVAVLAQQLLVIPQPLLVDSIALVDDVLSGCIARATEKGSSNNENTLNGAAIIEYCTPVWSAVLGVLAKSDDCVRKPRLARWYQEVTLKLHELYGN